MSGSFNIMGGWRRRVRTVLHYKHARICIYTVPYILYIYIHTYIHAYITTKLFSSFDHRQEYLKVQRDRERMEREQRAQQVRVAYVYYMRLDRSRWRWSVCLCVSSFTSSAWKRRTSGAERPRR